MLKKAVLVARVSTRAQADNFSLPTQLEGMRQYSARNGFEVVEELQDVISGAVEIQDRPGGAKLYELVAAQAMDVVIFFTVDRVARDDDVAELVILKRDLRRAGIELHFADSGQSDNSTLSGILDYIRASQATEERRKIRERIKRGIHGKAAERWVGGGHVLYGYKKVGLRKETQLVIDEVESAVVQRIFDAYVGDDRTPPMPMLTIAKRLTAERISPPLRPNGKKTAPRGWWTQTVHTLLKRRAYIGEFTYAGHSLFRPDLAIIDREIFEAAQARLDKNKRLSRRNQKHAYLLSGHLHCSCGGAMAGINCKGWLYYFCINSSRRRHLSSCREKRVRLDVADRVVWDWLYGLMGDGDNLRRGLRRKAAQDSVDSESKRGRLATVQELVPETETGVRGLVADLAALKDAGDLARESIREQIKSKGKLLKSLTDERNRLEAELERLELTPEQEARTLEEAASIKAGMGQANFATKRFWLDRLNFSANYRRDDTGRWLDALCTMVVQPVPLSLDHASQCRRGSA